MEEGFYDLTLEIIEHPFHRPLLVKPIWSEPTQIQEEETSILQEERQRIKATTRVDSGGRLAPAIGPVSGPQQ